MTAKDLENFWKADDIAHEQNCFNPAARQTALGIRMSEECVYAELNEEGDPWNIGALPPERRVELNKRYNDKAEEIVGKRLLPESFDPEDSRFPEVKRIGEVFGGRYEIGYKTGEWLHNPELNNPDDLETVLDRVDVLLENGAEQLKAFVYPENWEPEKRRIFEEYGKRPDVIRWIRGPITLATSLYGIENFTYLYMDSPDLYRRFSDSIRKVILALAGLSDSEAGYSEGEAPRGFGFADDDSQLMTPDMYEQFGLPILQSVFDRYAPDPKDGRYQHSDSAMGHLLPHLAKVRLNGCNFGPTVLVEEIRQHLPEARIDGCIAPFTFMHNDQDKIRSEVKRDCEAIKRTGTKGLNITTAGSINNGSLLTSMRCVMEAITEYGLF